MKAFKKQLVSIPGIGQRKADWIVESGVRSISRLASLSKDELISLKGIGPDLAARIMRHLRPLRSAMQARTREAAAHDSPPDSEPACAEPEGGARAMARRFRAEFAGIADVLKEVFETVVILLGDRCLGAGRAGA